jgi:hypothetical protein
MRVLSKGVGAILMGLLLSVHPSHGRDVASAPAGAPSTAASASPAGQGVASEPAGSDQSADTHDPSKPTPATLPVAASRDDGAPDSVLWIKQKSPAQQLEHEASLGDYVILKLNTPLADVQASDKIGHRAGLYINDLFFKDLPTLGVVGRADAVMFHLRQTDENRELWGTLFAKKSFTLGGRGSCRERPGNPIHLTVGYEDGTQVGPYAEACLEYFPNGKSAAALLFFALALIVVTVYLAARTSMLRDPGISRQGAKTTWSLARVQMALWFVSVVCGVLFLYAVTGDIPAIPDGVLILVGIGAGTAVSSFAIDAGGIPGSKADYDAVTAAQAPLDAEVVRLDAAVKVALAANDPAAANLQRALADARTAAGGNLARGKSFESPSSRSFFYDILSDGNGIAFHRLQALAWTLTYWFIFIAALVHKITLTDFTPTQLGLMGISGATYLGFKLSEPPKTPGSGQGSRNP